MPTPEMDPLATAEANALRPSSPTLLSWRYSAVSLPSEPLAMASERDAMPASEIWLLWRRSFCKLPRDPWRTW